MPVSVKHIGGKHRLVEADGSISMSKNGKARDGGGHMLSSKANFQRDIINKAIATKAAKK
jgi:hypothetical protein